MTEERITRTETPDGNTHTETTIVRDTGGSEKSGSKGWVFLLILAVAVIGGIFFLNQMSDSAVVKDTAIADAAEQVGNAAEQAGDAVEEVADDVTGAE